MVVNEIVSILTVCSGTIVTPQSNGYDGVNDDTGNGDGTDYRNMYLIKKKRMATAVYTSIDELSHAIIKFRAISNVYICSVYCGWCWCPIYTDC